LQLAGGYKGIQVVQGIEMITGRLSGG
jgi:hypothetical protein